MAEKVLNPKLWKNEELIQEVTDKLEEIAFNFVDNLKEDEIELEIKDIVIVGSNANFNYNETSDIDLHIIADMSNVEDEEEKRLLCILYNAYKTLFNNKYDITVKGHDVEVYVEPDEPAVQSGGIYSLYTGWLRKPEQDAINTDEDEEFNKVFKKWEDRYLKIIADEEIPEKEIIEEKLVDRERKKLEDIEKFITALYELRKNDLAKEGENSLGNKLFKKIRRLGYLDNLKKLKIALEEKELSLEDLNKTNTITDEELFWHLRDGIMKNGKFINKTKYSERAKEVLDTFEGNIYVNSSGELDLYPNPDNMFAVSPEQYPKHLLNRDGLLKFKNAVKGEIVMFYNSTDEYGSEYSVLTSHEDLCIKACKGELGKEFAKQRAYAKYVDGEYQEVKINENMTVSESANKLYNKIKGENKK